LIVNIIIDLIFINLKSIEKLTQKIINFYFIKLKTIENLA